MTNDPRQVLIDALLRHQKRDIKSCDCGTWGSDHGHLGQRHSVHVADVQLAELAAAGYTVVKVAETGTGLGAQTLDGTVRPRAYTWGYKATHQRDEWYGDWRPVGEDDTDAG